MPRGNAANRTSDKAGERGRRCLPGTRPFRNFAVVSILRRSGKSATTFLPWPKLQTRTRESASPGASLSGELVLFSTLAEL